jgi:hypothetical protein
MRVRCLGSRGTLTPSLSARRRRRSRPATKTAGGHGNAQVVIRRKDGQIQSERTYDNDPRRRKG